jgi:agmatine deiminase
MKKQEFKNIVKYLFLYGILFLAIHACNNPNKKAYISDVHVVIRQSAEYEKLEAVWLIWPPEDHLRGYSNEKVTLEIIKHLIPHNNVVITVANDSLHAHALSSIPQEYIEDGFLKILKVPSEEFWIRDMGPVFVEIENGRKAIVDFNFNAWGYTPVNQMDEYTINMEKYDEKVAEMLQLPLISSNMISEAGAREMNSQGILMVVEAVEIQRNPEMSKEEIELEFKRVLGAQKVIWLKEGLVEDQHTFLGPLKLDNNEFAYTCVTTNGHIDEFARFVNDSTILLAEVVKEERLGEIGAENHNRMEENYQLLKNEKDLKGNSFHIIRVPLPPVITESMKPGDVVYDYISKLDYQDGSKFPVGKEVNVIAAASYLNFLIANNIVIAQKYWSEGMDITIRDRDKKVKKILEQVFPNREVVMLDALAVNFGGGGIHCITMQEPYIDN